MLSSIYNYLYELYIFTTLIVFKIYLVIFSHFTCLAGMNKHIGTVWIYTVWMYTLCIYALPFYTHILCGIKYKTVRQYI